MAVSFLLKRISQLVCFYCIVEVLVVVFVLTILVQRSAGARTGQSPVAHSCKMFLCLGRKMVEAGGGSLGPGPLSGPE